MKTRLILGTVSFLLLAVTACSSSTGAPQASAYDLAVTPLPAGVDAALWSELTAELAAQLASRGTSAAKSIDDPALRVTDFALIAEDPETRTLTFGWSYKLAGDYDLNGEVTISDLAPIAKYLDHTEASPDWEQARFADGDGNGVVNSSDIVSIAANFGTKVHGFWLSPEFGDYNQNGLVEITDLTGIGQMKRENPGTAFFGPAFTQQGELAGDFGEPRTSDADLPERYLSLYGFRYQSTERTTVGGRLHFRGYLGYVPHLSSTYFTVTPFIETGASHPEPQWEVGQLADQILYVHPQ